MGDDVERHYTVEGLVDTIKDGLRAEGKDFADLSPVDLAAIDEFHVRGREATLDLIRHLDLEPGHQALDIGCGKGGGARLLAETFGCQVTGIDLTQAYCDVASILAEWVGLQDRVTFIQGNALDLPFDEASFDAAITQHAAMNIADKDRLYRETRRVLKTGGTFAIYDILQGAGGDILYPVPWAREPSISFVATPDDMRRHLKDAGFEIVHWRDTSDLGLRFFEAIATRIGETGLPPVGWHLLMGPDFKEMAANQRQNLGEDRIVLAEIVCRAV